MKRGDGHDGMQCIARIKVCISLSVLVYPLVFLPNCKVQIPVGDIDRKPSFSEADRKFAHVYKPLDGTWRGKFHVYELKAEGDLPPSLAVARPIIKGDWEPGPLVKAGALKLKQTIDVEQVYVSESPYFQRVRIRDAYLDAKGERRVIKSRGVNKVQDGVMWCVVRKPHEMVVHRGGTEGKDVIIWQRSLESPRRIEYFHETVRENSYTIRGWGYYGKHAPSRSPRLWFLGEYKRVK